MSKIINSIDYFIFGNILRLVKVYFNFKLALFLKELYKISVVGVCFLIRVYYSQS